MADAAVPGSGSVVVVLQEERVELKCSVGAALWVCRNGGFKAVIDQDETVYRRLLRLDIDTMAALIRQGLGVGNAAIPALEERIYQEGLATVSAQVEPFLVALMNGGKPKSVVAPTGDATANPQSGAGS